MFKYLISMVFWLLTLKASICFSGNESSKIAKKMFYSRLCVLLQIITWRWYLSLNRNVTLLRNCTQNKSPEEFQGPEP